MFFTIICSLVAEDEPDCKECPTWVGGGIGCGKHHTCNIEYPDCFGIDCMSADSESQPAPIEWEVGDWAIHRDHGLVKIDYMHKTSCILSCGLIVMLSNLRIPTRDQLGVEIGDSGVMAWACEVGDKVMLYFSNGTEWYGGTDRNTDVMRHMCKALGIIVLTRSQVERDAEHGGFGGVYPPEK